jgi:hypothetical protein
MELKELIHFGEYLCEMLVKITNSLDITHAIFTVTQDNALANNVVLSEFESEAYLQRMASPVSA